MKSINFSTHIHYLDDFRDLEHQEDQNLCVQSMQAMNEAYAAYSNYHVGASVYLANDLFIRGGNQENAVYPLGLCAERVTLFSAASQHPGIIIKSLAVSTKKALKPNMLPPFPCGSCRQVLLEMEQRQSANIRLFVVGSDRRVCIINSVRDILPFAFDKSDL